MEKDNYRNQEQDRRLFSMEESVKTINSEMGDIKISLTKVKTDVCWLKKSYWVIFTASVGSLIAAVFGLLSR